MSDDHEALANDQEREADDLEHRSEALGEHIDEAKQDAADLDSSQTIATPDPTIEDVDQRPGPGKAGPTLPADER